ncbi:arabinose ABC transporter permease [Rhodoferax koreense]|uniref:Arabinose ABC transporter permease n=1 Tax=Rhodoferax koreensis TaxID=1842727 RepID=A0A1P8K435_9BURK|nr:arabinose ABC transporter permease [Rhodoferax koreense]
MWTTLRHASFRGLWGAGAVYFIGNAMQTMAAAWMMVELTGSSFLAALVQTAVFLPMFLLSLPAGVLADITDRRRLIQIALVVQAVTGTLLALLLLSGVGGAATLLFFIFVAGSCTALLSPAWNSSIADSVPREELPLAITVVSIAYNAARAVGPALAGVVFSAFGGAWNFALAVGSTLAMLWSIQRWPPRPHPPSRLPAERLWGGMLSALRFAWHSHTVLAQLVRTVAYSGAGSALWALLPVIGAKQLNLGAAGYGLLMGCLGTGAVLVGLVIGRLRLRFGLEAIVGTGCVVFATVMVIAAFSHWAPLVYLALVCGGAAWMAVMSTFNTATQTSVPPWVRARALAMHTLCALGSFALGSAFWGALSDIFGLDFALCLAALAMGCGLLLARPFPLRMGEKTEITQVPQATQWEELFIKDAPAPEAGPVAVEMAYKIRSGESAAFLEAVSHLRAPRRRDGATFWRIYRDLADPSRFVERFIVTSWADYLHQRARATLADQELEAHVRSFLAPGVTVTMQHYLAER